MAVVLVLLIGLGVIDIRKMMKDKDIKQAVIYCIFGIMTFVFGVWFLSSQKEHSFCYELFDLLGIFERQ